MKRFSMEINRFYTQMHAKVHTCVILVIACNLFVKCLHLCTKVRTSSIIMLLLDTHKLKQQDS